MKGSKKNRIKCGANENWHLNGAQEEKNYFLNYFMGKINKVFVLL